MFFGRRGLAFLCLFLFVILGILPVCAVSDFSEARISEDVTGSTGSVRILKTDLKGEPIPGAEYRLLRGVTLEEHREGNLQTQWIQVDGEGQEMTQVPFYLHSGSSSEPVFQVFTDENGVAHFYGIPYGIYYIQEVSVPLDYEPQPRPVEARINEQTTGATILIETNPAAPRKSPVVTLLAVALAATAGSAGILILMNGKGECP